LYKKRVTKGTMQTMISKNKQKKEGRKKENGGWGDKQLSPLPKATPSARTEGNRKNQKRRKNEKNWRHGGWTQQKEASKKTKKQMSSDIEGGTKRVTSPRKTAKTMVKR